jgi:L-alanine-DL-glutamate epimerase-like enolase superfamily enzyme
MSSSDLSIDRFEFRELGIRFKTAFRHAAAERTATETVWIDAVASDGAAGSGESCPRSYVTGEAIATARAFVSRHEASLRSSITDIETLQAWMADHEEDIDANPAAWCALELALLDLIGKHMGVTVETLLSVQPLGNGAFRYTAVLGDAPATAFHAMAERYREVGFRDFKIKLSGSVERDREKMAVFDKWTESVRLRADANNLWPAADEAIGALGRLGYAFFAIEEPIGKDQHAELPRIARALNCAVILDESFSRVQQLSLLCDPAALWFVNIRVSKMGGLIRSLRVLQAARARGIGVIVGAQVGETSLLTRAALTVACAAGNALVAQEGAFGTLLLERDVCDPPLMFGAGGVLDASAYPMLEKPGLGVTFNTET